MDNNPVFFSDPSGADARSVHELYHNGAPARLNTRDFNGGRAHDYATRASTAAGGYEDNNKNGTRNYGNDLIGALNDLGVNIPSVVLTPNLILCFLLPVEYREWTK